MRSIVHFSLGVSVMLVVLTFVNLDYRHEFLLMFLSGFWAMVPDLGWLLLRIGMPGTAAVWKAVFNSPLGLIFWLSPYLDGLEPVNRVFEMTSAFTMLGIGIVVYYFGNDWEGHSRPT